MGTDIKYYIAVHKEFDNNHNIMVTIAKSSIKKRNYQEVLGWCERVNKNGFNYKPYPEDESIIELSLQENEVSNGLKI